MRIIFIRHSKTTLDKVHSNLVWNLSDEGIELATKLAQNDTIKRIAVFFTSDQTKALHTTLLLAKESFISIRVVPELTETTSLTNGFFENYEARMHQWYTEPGHRINDGETREESLTRFSSAIKRIVSSNTDKQTIGIVSHANVLSLYVGQFDERGALGIHNSLKMPDYAILDWDSKKLLKQFGE